MEVICTKDNFYKCPCPRCQRLEYPKKDEIYNVHDETVNDGKKFIALKEVSLDGEYPYFPITCFANITKLDDEINSALKAKNPNIKKFSLVELKVIGYNVSCVTDEDIQEAIRKGLC